MALVTPSRMAKILAKATSNPVNLRINIFQTLTAAAVPRHYNNVRAVTTSINAPTNIGYKNRHQYRTNGSNLFNIHQLHTVSCLHYEREEAHDLIIASSELQDSTTEPIKVSDAAIERINEVNIRKGYNPPKALRIQVNAGKCSGYAYSIRFTDESRDDDIVLQKNGAKVLVDEASVPFLEGATIDFVTQIGGRSFAVVDNPNAESGCGCGISFNVKGDVDFDTQGF